MERRENQTESQGICHRLFTFFIDNLATRALKRVTLGHPTCHGFPQNSLATSSAHIKPSPEIAVAYINSIVHIEKPNALSNSTDPTPDAWFHVMKEDHNLQSLKTKCDEEDERPAPSVAKDAVSVKESGEEVCIPKRKRALPKDNVKQSIDSEKDMVMMKVPRPLKPVLRSTSNINEKSDAFIRRRRESLRSSSNIEPRTLS